MIMIIIIVNNKREYKQNFFLGNCYKECSLQEKKLNEIKKIIIDIKNRIPFDGILPSEHIVPPIIGEVCYFKNK